MDKFKKLDRLIGKRRDLKAAITTLKSVGNHTFLYKKKLVVRTIRTDEPDRDIIVHNKLVADAVVEAGVSLLERQLEEVENRINCICSKKESSWIEQFKS